VLQFWYQSKGYKVTGERGTRARVVDPGGERGAGAPGGGGLRVEQPAEDAVRDQAAGLDHAPVVVQRVLVDAEAAVLVRVQEALGRQVDQGLADGGRGDAVLLGDLLDRELLARLEASAQHLVAERVRDLLPQGAAGDGAIAAAGAGHRPFLPRSGKYSLMSTSQSPYAFGKGPSGPHRSCATPCARPPPRAPRRVRPDPPWPRPP
jgi:hypothetical protein